MSDCANFSRDGCSTSEDIYWKLDALQGFIQDLNWPEEEFAKYLQVRMRNLASEMISKCASWSVQSFFIFLAHLYFSFSSTYQCFDQFMQRAKKSLDWTLPCETCVMINVMFASKTRATKLSASNENTFAGMHYGGAQSQLDDTLDTMLADMCTITVWKWRRKRGI